MVTHLSEFFQVARLLAGATLYKQIFADVIVYILPSLAYSFA